MNEGIIYIARNPEYKENIFKVGKTERTNLPYNRMLELSNHEGVLGQFNVLGYLLVDNVHESEKICHQKLKDYRYQNNREFFQINIKNLAEQLREFLSDSIIRDNLPKFKEQEQDKEHLKSHESSKAFENFMTKMSDLVAYSLHYSPNKTFHDFASKIRKELKKIPSQEELTIGLSPWNNGISTPGNEYFLQLIADHKDFIGFDLLWTFESLEIENIKKYYNECGDDASIRQYEMIIQDNPEYINNANKTRNKLNKIYNNDKLYMEYTKKTSSDFNNINDYIFYAFFTKARKEEIIDEMTDEKKVWKEKVVRVSSKFKPSTIFFKGSTERIVAELSTIIESDIPDELIKLPLDESNSIIKTCPKCKTKIRLPKGKSGKVKCPNCEKRFNTTT